MKTREAILREALKLFAMRGYEAVSVADIADKLGMTKGALYRHYKNKRDILDHIILRMQENDAKRAKEFEVPQETYEKTPQEYENGSFEAMCLFTKAQFQYWTEDEFASDFRRMLTLEQYRDKEMMQLYQDYLCSGVIAYLEDFFREIKETGGRGDADPAPRQQALDLFGPFYMLLNMYDVAEEKEKVKKDFEAHLEKFRIRFKGERKISAEKILTE